MLIGIWSAQSLVPFHSCCVKFYDSILWHILMANILLLHFLAFANIYSTEQEKLLFPSPKCEYLCVARNLVTRARFKWTDKNTKLMEFPICEWKIYVFFESFLLAALDTEWITELILRFIWQSFIRSLVVMVGNRTFCNDKNPLLFLPLQKLNDCKLISISIQWE